MADYGTMNSDALDDPPNVAVRETPEGTPVGDPWESAEPTRFRLNHLDHEETLRTLRLGLDTEPLPQSAPPHVRRILDQLQPLTADVCYRRGSIPHCGHGTEKNVELCARPGRPQPDFGHQPGSFWVRFLPGDAAIRGRFDRFDASRNSQATHRGFDPTCALLLTPPSVAQTRSFNEYDTGRPNGDRSDSARSRCRHSRSPTSSNNPPTPGEPYASS